MTVFRYVSAQSPIALPMVAILLLLSRFFHFLLLHSSVICLDNLSISALWLLRIMMLRCSSDTAISLTGFIFTLIFRSLPSLKRTWCRVLCSLRLGYFCQWQFPTLCTAPGHLVSFQSLRPVGTFTFSGIQ